jgi:nickel superoxide dismutase
MPMRPHALLVTFATIALAATVAPSIGHAHCQIPCGIYGDAARVKSVREDVATIRKSVSEIRKLASRRDVQSRNQLVRWVMNKEHHAERVMRTIADYFMAQKIKSSAKDYAKRLIAHHAVMVAAMKCKQTADPKFVDALKRAVDGIAGYWKH